MCSLKGDVYKDASDARKWTDQEVLRLLEVTAHTPHSALQRVWLR